MAFTTVNPSPTSRQADRSTTSPAKRSLSRWSLRSLDLTSQATALDNLVYAACGTRMSAKESLLRCGTLCGGHTGDVDRIASQVWIHVAELLRFKPTMFYRDWQHRGRYIRDYVARVDVSATGKITISWVGIMQRLQRYIDTAKHAGPPRHWEMIRHADPTGISGTGKVALIDQYPTGICFVQWLSLTPSINTYLDLADVAGIHGHEGDTELRETSAPT